MYNLQFLVTEEEHALRSYRSTPEGQLLSIENVFDGSLGYRVRCCAARRNVKSMSESEWIVTNTKWPVNIFIKVNGSPVFVRRQSHNGKDLPVSITELIHVGVNRVEVAIPEESHKAGPRPNFFFGVEIIETAHCNRTVDNIKKYGVHDASVTINKINTRLQTTTSEDDEFAVLQDSISVDLADPFSAKIFKIPVRGVQYARPSSLRIDKFLVDVRAKLKEMGKLDKVKSILVGLDGKWESVAIVDDDPEGDDNDDAGVISGKRKAEDTRTEQPPRKLIRMASDPNVTTSARRTASAAQPPRAIDIIEIDD
ncbi:hypothetical protein SBRCBS47491_006254 [Sporothrix bragantina]|uniref:Uncharacterized protein n=1 Tax=Sporothrix bragantina TaxID=671064 RepID=A0ABP0C5J9_9PEZI